MSKSYWSNIRLAVLVLSIGILACGGTVPETNTPSPAPKNTLPPPTNTVAPTVTLYPTQPPNATETQQAASNQATVQKYVAAGYLTSTNGTFTPLTASTFNMAQKNYLYLSDAGINDLIGEFAAWADLQWESASKVSSPEYSGCGFAFRYQNNGDGYTAMLTENSVLLTSCQAAKGHFCDRIGKTKGSGTVAISEPYQAHFELIVSKGFAYVLINGEFIGSYALLPDKIVAPGYFLYTLISGTNKDYGTRCTISNGTLFVPSS
jgi:hypothetical protein